MIWTTPSRRRQGARMRGTAKMATFLTSYYFVLVVRINCIRTFVLSQYPSHNVLSRQVALLRRAPRQQGLQLQGLQVC